MKVSEEETHRREIIARLRRVEGQIRGIQRMIESQAECEDVARQMAASRRALDKAFYQMLACSMERELTSADEVSEADKKAVTHITKILAKYG